MKVGDTVARFFAELAGTPEVRELRATPTSTAPSLTAKKSRKPAPVKAAIGLQDFALAHTSAGRQGPVTYFYVLPSTSGRVAAYPVCTERGMVSRISC